MSVYCAPEVAATGRFSQAADVYAFGVLSLQLCCGVGAQELQALWQQRSSPPDGSAHVNHSRSDTPRRDSDLQHQRHGSAIPTSEAGADAAATAASAPAVDALIAALPSACPTSLVQLLAACVAHAMEARPSFEQVAAALQVLTPQA